MKQIIYSILQYRHSLLREEKFNIGITFYFPEIDNKIIFYPAPRIEILKGIYPNLDYKTLKLHINYITSNINNNKIYPHLNLPIDLNLKLFLKQFVLLEDSTVLQFSDPVIISNLDSTDPEEIMRNYTNILLSFNNSIGVNNLQDSLTLNG